MFNPQHLLLGLESAHRMNQSLAGNKSLGGNQPLINQSNSTSPNAISENHPMYGAMKTLHNTLVAHHMTQLAKHAHALSLLHGGKGIGQ